MATPKKKPAKKKGAKARVRKPMSKASREKMRVLWRQHSKKRADRYRKDPDYRQAVLDAARTAVQKRRGTKLTDCRDNLPYLDEIGTRRSVLIDSVPSLRVSFSLREAAEALGLSLSRLRVWIRDGIIPGPVAEALRDDSVKAVGDPSFRLGNVPVYLKQEIQILVELTGEHRSRISYIRADKHQSLIKHIANVIKIQRGKLHIG